MTTVTPEKHQENPLLQEAHQHFRAAHDAMKNSWEVLLPAGFIENRRAARKEILKALRNLVDAAIEKAEKK